MEPKKILSAWLDEVTPAAVRAAFSRYSPPALPPPSLVPPPYRDAAVLLPLVRREEGLTVLFTQRDEHLEHHPGEVCFPGGKPEARDGTLLATALRETGEETGLDEGNADVVGALQPRVSRHGYLVIPFAALVQPQVFTPKKGEVGEIFEVPLAGILASSFARTKEERIFRWKEHGVTGFTAGVLRNFIEVVRDR